jgi:glyoxylase-like metal-dependent hydrolase (beta-lactamase superfamily II)
MRFRNIVATATLAFVVANIGLPAMAQEVKRSITKVSGEVYRFQNNFHYSVFVVTDDGIVYADPINKDAANWVKAEMDKRFGKSVTRLVYSHSHFDHASGGTVFTDTATTIVQENAPTVLDGVVPDVRFANRMSFRSGKHTFELTSLGSGHGTDMLAMVIRPENVAYIVDVVSPGRMLFKDLAGIDIDGMIEQIKKIEQLKFEIVTGGHSRLGKMADIVEAREYTEWLRDAVADQLKRGKTVEDIVANLDTSAYKHLLAYDMWRDLNIQGMARYLQYGKAL